MRKLLRKGRQWLTQEILTELKSQRQLLSVPTVAPALPAPKKSAGMRMDPFGTHQALLVAAMAQTDGDIVEIGGGWYSTPLVSAFSAANPMRRSYTIETGQYVFDILSKLQHERHIVELMPGFEFDQVGKFTVKAGSSQAVYLAAQLRYLEAWWQRRGAAQKRLSVAFVDHAPGFLRVPAIQFLADKADYVITHDTEHTRHYGYEPTLSSFAHRWDFTLHRPNAVVLSNFHDCKTFAFLNPQQQAG